MPKTVTTDNRLYPVVLHRDGDVWGYASPQFGGGGAPTQADALRAAQELLTSAVNELFEDGLEVPLPPAPEDVEAEGGVVAWLPVVVSNASERLTITLPTSLVAKIDGVTSNRSGFFAELARERLGQ